jgi:hypothetical protein
MVILAIFSIFHEILKNFIFFKNANFGHPVAWATA